MRGKRCDNLTHESVWRNDIQHCDGLCCAGGIHNGHVVRGVNGTARDVAAGARAHILHASRKPESSKMR
jgi:hypothetical protein